MSSFNNLMIEPPLLGNGLVLWTKMDEGQGSTAFDTSGKNNNGTLVNSPTWTTGKKGNCLSFSGGSQYVQINDNASLNLTTSKFSIS